LRGFRPEIGSPLHNGLPQTRLRTHRWTDARSPPDDDVLGTNPRYDWKRFGRLSQAITYVDVASIAHRFGAAYNLTVSRLLGLDLISEADNERLLKRKSVELANLWLGIFGPDTGDVHPSNPVGAVVQLSNRVTELSGLDAERLHLFIEAYRRGLADKSDLPVELSVLVPGLSQETLLQFVEAAR
jgi:hypothetical protein